jgi:two-component system nitrogen regulation sensor histidine kinase NtrY
MSFRRRLLLLFAVLVFVSVAAVAWVVSSMARRAFDRTNDERTAALVARFRDEFGRRGEEVARRTEAASSTGEAARMAVAAAQPSPNYNAFLDDAQTVAEIQRLDFLEFCDDRDTIVSSAQWPAKFGYQEPLLRGNVPASAFLKVEETPSGSALGLFAIHLMTAGEHKLYVIGGARLDRTFLSTLDLPAGMRVMLYQNLDAKPGQFSREQLITASDEVADPEPVAPLIEKVRRDRRDANSIIRWKSGADETMNAFPLFGEKNQVLGILLVGSSRQVYVELRNQIRSAALLATSVGLVLAILLSSWAAVSVTRPLEKLAQAAQEVAGGKWNASVEVESKDEIGQLADSFNRMTRELLEQHEHLVQAERVAAWRELARRLAHELKNPLFPLQLTVENLLRARESGPQEFDDTFGESAATLLTEITNLKSIIGRFSEFSKMPQPHFQMVQLSELLENVAKVHHAQLERAAISSRYEFAGCEPIAADPDLLYRAVSNLVLNAIDAMPKGGMLTLRVRSEHSSARIEISDTGMGIKPEERERLFTPYYTSKPHGTGLGLAIVQSIVSDHAGRISVESEPGRGTTFIIELPKNLDKLPTAQGTHV